MDPEKTPESTSGIAFLVQTGALWHKHFRLKLMRHNDYGYTQAWVDFLIEKLKDTVEFDAVCKGDHASDTASQST